ncbi:universal stress protein [Kineosporiaceae bacterium SCSIO 59966]|nr:universal stress protein [Kineosporiaceae bacterium SCSIO 59966]
MRDVSDEALDIRLAEPDPVVVAVDGSPESRLAAHEGALEALLRGAPLRLVGVDTPVGTLSALTARLTGLYPGLSVAAQRAGGRAVDVLRRLSAESSVLVLGAPATNRTGALAGSAVCRELVRTSSCPLLVARGGSGPVDADPGVVVAHAAGRVAAALPVLDAAVAAAVRRHSALRVVRPYLAGSGERPAAALARVRGDTTRLLAVLGADTEQAGVSVTTVHTGDGGPRVIADHSRDAALVVLGGDVATEYPWVVDESARTVLVVPHGARHRREACLEIYRQALLDELARTVPRPDGCTTPAELDDAWRVGMDLPAVGPRVPLAWRACLQGAAEPVADGPVGRVEERRPSWS